MDGGAATEKCYTKNAAAGGDKSSASKSGPLAEYKGGDKNTLCKKAADKAEIEDKNKVAEANVKDAKACATKCNALADKACKGFQFDNNANDADKKCTLIKEDLVADASGEAIQACYLKMDAAELDALENCESDACDAT